MTILDKYLQELEEDTTLDEFSVKDKQLKLPGIKHKWVGRLIRHKMKINTLREKKKEVLSQLSEALIKTSPYKITTPAAEKACLKHEKIIEINQEIYDEGLVVEFLEKIEKVLTSMTYDIKNVVEIMKLETL